MDFSDITYQGRIAIGGVGDFASQFFNPVLRLGVTGLAGSGKTIFITALVHALLNNSQLPLFEAHMRGRIKGISLAPQPDDHLPRFAYESHLEALTSADRCWPESTTNISQLRLTIDYIPQSSLLARFNPGRLHIDIIDYPGEWLLDLPLLHMDYATWSAATITDSEKEPRLTLARDWHAYLHELNPQSKSQEYQLLTAAKIFTAYLASCRKREFSLSSLAPGRFLMPGDWAGSPLLSFAPLRLAPGDVLERGSLAQSMARRYEAYREKLVKPFYLNHFSRLDRQIILVDVLSSLNAGSAAIVDLQTSLEQILDCFRVGSNSLWSTLFGRHIDRILFAATKADWLHHESHDRLEAILRAMLEQYAKQAHTHGARTHAAALSAIRATREARVRQNNDYLACIAGTPEMGEKIGHQEFDGQQEAAIFPGDLPENPQKALKSDLKDHLKFLAFRPPILGKSGFPHIRLDRAIEFLIGDRLV